MLPANMVDVKAIQQKRALRNNLKALFLLVRPEEFESPTSWSVARRSIQLSYGRT